MTNVWVDETPIYTRLMAERESTPIFDQLVEKYTKEKYEELVEHYAYSLNDKRAFSLEDFVEMMTRNQILSVSEIRKLFGWPEETLNKENNMEKLQHMVNEFRKAADLPIADGPRTLSTDEQQLHIQMIRDEFEKELIPAILDNDLIEMYDGAIDMIVYLIGLLSNAGLDLEPGFKEVHRGNMSKADPVTGKFIRAGLNDPSGEPAGKVLKGPNYKAPNLAPIINEMTREGHEDKRVYRTKNVPLTLGEGGPVIGSAVVDMDNNGNMEIEATIEDTTTLPILNYLGYDLSALSIGEARVHTDDLRTFGDHEIMVSVDSERSFENRFEAPIHFDPPYDR